MTQRSQGSAAPGQEGAALPLFLLLLLALTLLAHGALVLSQAELQASHGFRHAVRADRAAQGAISRSLRIPGGFPGPRVPDSVTRLFSGWVEETLWSGGVLRWLGSEVFLIEGTGRSRGWAGSRRSGAVGWALDPLTRLGALAAGIEAGGSVTAGPGVDLSASDPRGLPAEWDSLGCSDFGTALDSLFTDRVFPLSSPLPAEDSLPSGGGSRIPGLGLLSGSRLLALGEEPKLLEVPGGEGFASVGCPGDGRSVMWSTDADLDFAGGRYCGLLVVEGDLRILGGAVVQGLLFVGGDLFLAEDGRFEGMARIRGSIHLLDSAKLRVLGCPAIRALSETSELLKPLVIPEASRIPLF